MSGDIPLLIAGFSLLIVGIIEIFRIRRLEQELSSALTILGYYRIRFGNVTTEDMENMVGITDEKIKNFLEDLEKKNIEKNEK